MELEKDLAETDRMPTTRKRIQRRALVLIDTMWRVVRSDVIQGLPRQESREANHGNHKVKVIPLFFYENSIKYATLTFNAAFRALLDLLQQSSEGGFKCEQSSQRKSLLFNSNYILFIFNFVWVSENDFK